MNAYDKFLIGDTTSIDWCFENRHFNERLSDNGISRNYVVDCLMYEEPIKCEHIDKDTYAVVFNAPANKDYREIRIVMVIKGNSIDIITIMRNDETVTERQKRQYQSSGYKNIEKKRKLAEAKRKKW